METVQRFGNGVKRGLPIAYDPANDLVYMMRLTLDELNKDNISPYILKGNFKIPRTGFRIIRPWVEPFLKKETGKEAARRLVGLGLNLANPADLAIFLLHHPQEWSKWNLIMALNEDSLWENDNNLYAVGAKNYRKSDRGYSQWSFHKWGFHDLTSFEERPEGILVSASN